MEAISKLEARQTDTDWTFIFLHNFIQEDRETCLLVVSRRADANVVDRDDEIEDEIMRSAEDRERRFKKCD